MEERQLPSILRDAKARGEWPTGMRAFGVVCLLWGGLAGVDRVVGVGTADLLILEGGRRAGAACAALRQLAAGKQAGQSL